MQDDSANKLLLFGRACVLRGGFGLLFFFFFFPWVNFLRDERAMSFYMKVWEVLDLMQ